MELLEKIQYSVNENFWEINAQANTDDAETKPLVLAYYKNYLEINNIEIDGITQDELIVKLYNDTHKYSVLTQALEDDEVEGIHINAWNCVIIQFRNGEFFHANSFENPQHAVDIIRRLIQSKGKVLDNSTPIVETSISSNIRVTTVKSPIVDEHIGVSCYIRKLSKQTFTAQQYIQGGFADGEEIDMLKIFMKRGISMLIVGKVNSGKTTFLSYLLSTLSNNTKIVTIENSAREMDLVKNQNGETVNNVVHMITKESSNPNESIDQNDLLVTSLRLNPDYMSVAEMRDSEAYSAVEASRSGHPVISTTHAGSPREAHKRIADLSRKGNNTDYPTALIQAQEAFPIVVFIHMLEDNKRRIMGITECHVDDDNKPHYNPLWKFDIEDNEINDDELNIHGNHKQVGRCSEFLIEKMKMYGITKSEIRELGGEN